MSARLSKFQKLIRENRITDIEYLSENVNLYLTYARLGSDQTLVPINEISNIHDFKHAIDLFATLLTSASSCTASECKRGLLQ